MDERLFISIQYALMNELEYGVIYNLNYDGSQFGVHHTVLIGHVYTEYRDSALQMKKVKGRYVHHG